MRSGQVDLSDSTRFKLQQYRCGMVKWKMLTLLRGNFCIGKIGKSRNWWRRTSSKCQRKENRNWMYSGVERRAWCFMLDLFLSYKAVYIKILHQGELSSVWILTGCSGVTEGWDKRRRQHFPAGDNKVSYFNLLKSRYSQWISPTWDQ